MNIKYGLFSKYLFQRAEQHGGYTKLRIFGRADMPQHSIIKNVQLVCVSIQYFFRPSEAMEDPDKKFSLLGSRPKNIFQTHQNLNLLSVVRIRYSQ